MTDSLKTLQGNCHCGANRYDIQLPEFPALVICDCTLCFKKAYVWLYDTEDKLKVTRGCAPETLTKYTSSSGLEHEFCSSCGTGLFGTHASGAHAGKRGINLRALVSGLDKVFVNGKAVMTLNADGKPAPYPGSLSLVEMTSAVQDAGFSFRGTLPELTVEYPKLYTGSCACGDVQIALRTKPLNQVEIKEDNCSICIRIGGVGVYPHKSQVAIVGKEHTEDYKFGRKFNGSPFCRTCGVFSFGILYGPPAEMVARLPEAKQEFVRKQLEIQPLNVRILDGVEWDKIDINWSNEGTEGYSLQD
ncbi:glutathione-dependent formaldehyde-activating gfa [Colletotrichum sojae]|uniref:Glutathione-dependent formaldehyde-activating gfa n=1 Tax=Colletotrichum sojae TaxID=2175907 RepID=A0A8H6MV54_9PEZI|nr:glutathione-dependent formaldehyde-activating gfa [Colletotrichum sojae]